MNLFHSANYLLKNTIFMKLSRDVDGHHRRGYQCLEGESFPLKMKKISSPSVNLYFKSLIHLLGHFEKYALHA